MSSQIFSNAKLWVAGFDWSGDVNELALKFGAEMKENTVLGAATRTRLPGLMNFSFAHKGFWNGGNNNIDDAIFNSVLAVDATVMSLDGQSSGTEGDVAFTGQVIAGAYEPGAKIGDMLEFGVSGDGDGPLVRGTLMAARTVTSSANGTGFQLGAVAVGQKMYASLHVLQGVAGTTPTLDVKLQSATSGAFSSPTDRITFTQKTAPGAQWGTPVAGSITDQWWRVVWTVGGSGGPSFPFVVTAGFR